MWKWAYRASLLMSICCCFVIWRATLDFIGWRRLHNFERLDGHYGHIVTSSLHFQSELAALHALLWLGPITVSMILGTGFFRARVKAS